jgi:hypothetical protein
MSAHDYTVMPAIFARSQRRAQMAATSPRMIGRAVLMNDSNRR